MYVQLILVIYPSVNEHLNCFYVSAIVNNATTNLGEQIPVVQVPASKLFGVYTSKTTCWIIWSFSFFEESVFLNFIFLNYYIVKLTSPFLEWILN